MNSEKYKWGKFKWHMFITSFLPLWFTICFIDIWQIVANFINIWDKEASNFDNFVVCLTSNLVPLISVLVIVVNTIISIAILEKYIHKHQKATNDCAKIISVKKESALTTQFLLSYILPLVAFDFCSLRDVIIFLLFFIVLAFLSIRNDYVYTNIYLEFRQYKIYICDIEIIKLDKANIFKECFILSKANLMQQINEKIPYWDFDSQHYIHINEVEN